ncbi:thioredoxin family protein [Paenibacillus septentrionalis]|uniref:Thioredoxin family protein n=1 Tax=Paenibacillus septentrionalis TaxID=429342 RepID=A0ABW1V9X2_9BACL
MHMQNKSIDDINEKQIHTVANMEVGRAAILFITPLCGTCKVALNMLNIVAATGVSYHVYQANINFTPYFRELWQIKSVPALAIIENGQLKEMVYAMQSVSTLYDRLK